MNDSEALEVTVEIEGEVPVTPPEIILLADLLPQLIKDILAMQADQED